MLWPKASSAQPPPPHREHVRFSYSAPDECPTSDEFVAHVRERSAEVIEDPEAARSLAVTIEHRDRWHGELHTEGIASGQGVREIDGDSCASVERSLAIFTAIALREGSPDELPPAHPELQKNDAADPNEGFMPMASIPATPPPFFDLHKHRFALTAKESVSEMNDGGRTVGVGAGVSYFLERWIGFDVEGALLLDLPPIVTNGDANEARARFLSHVELLTAHAHGAIWGSHRGRVFDQFIDVGVGAIFTRPRPERNLARASYEYSAAPLFDLGTGFRFFLDDDLAFSTQVDLLLYSQADATVDVGIARADTTTDRSTLAAGPVFQLGFTWFPTRAREWPQ